MSRSEDLARWAELDVQGRTLNTRAAGLLAKGRYEEATRAGSSAVVALRELMAVNLSPVDALSIRAEQSRTLNNLGIGLSHLGRHTEALRAAEEAVSLGRELIAIVRSRFLADLAGAVNNLGTVLSKAGEHIRALAALREAAKLYRELVLSDRAAHLPNLAATLSNLGAGLRDMGRREEALATTREAVELHRELVSMLGARARTGLVSGLTNLCAVQVDLGLDAQALAPAREAVRECRELAQLGSDLFQPSLARSSWTLGVVLSNLSRAEEALACVDEACALLRQLLPTDRAAYAPRLAQAFHSRGICLDRLGRRDEALAAAEESVRLYGELADGARIGSLPDVAAALNSLAIRLSKQGRRVEGLAAAKAALQKYRDLVSVSRDAALPGLARCLTNVSGLLSDLGRRADALDTLTESVALRRELVLRDDGNLPGLALSLSNLTSLLNEHERYADASGAGQEAIALYRQLKEASRAAFSLHLGASLLNQTLALKRLGCHGESAELLRTSAATLLECLPNDPFEWGRLCINTVRNFEAADDVKCWILPLLRRVSDHRELAWSTEHAEVMVVVQAHLAARVWELCTTVPTIDRDLVDEAVTVLVATLQSPDLGRWLQMQDTSVPDTNESTVALGRLKREVIEADQVLNALLRRLAGDDAGGEAGSRAIGFDSLAQDLLRQVEEQAAKAKAVREAFRAERAHVVESDPKFRSTFEPLTVQALRAATRHGQGSALLCLLDLRRGEVGTDDTGERSPDRHRIVGALVHADGRRTQLLEFPEVNQLAWRANEHRPEGIARDRHGPLRGAPPASSERPAGRDLPPITDLLAPRIGEAFWAPLQRAVQEAGVTIERLHVCTHGLTQQLPLALRETPDLPGVQVLVWPGLPYLRRAATTTTAAASTAKPASAPWLIGHDCAWGSERPLPMVAVEAALLRDLLLRHNQPAQAIRAAAQVRGQASALVACCHGGAEQTHFDHALHLGGEPLTVRRIMQDNIGPPLALLPACHAGRTDEDAAGNALGIAAAFILSGTKVVAASSKAVPDLLQPWLSTLIVWHAMQGLPHHEAATAARGQFAKLEFPPDYRRWLQEALRPALATIQPGGEEDRHIRGVAAHLALASVVQHWPWEGDTQHLFSVERSLRDEATRSVAEGILKPRGGEEGARELAAAAREMAAFVFVYGVA